MNILFYKELTINLENENIHAWDIFAQYLETGQVRDTKWEVNECCKIPGFIKVKPTGWGKITRPPPARPHRIRVKEIQTSGCVKQLRVMKQKGSTF